MKKLGLGLALAGLFVAILAVVPGVVAQDVFPWPLIVGSFVYLHGAFLLVFSTKGQDRKVALSTLRLVRLGFVAVFAVIIFRLMPL